MKISDEELERRFSYHGPTPEKRIKYANIRSKGLELAKIIVDLCPHSREASTALTKAEEAVMWANASIAREGENENER